MGEDRESEDEIEVGSTPDQSDEDLEHVCDYDEDGFCPTCQTFYEPDDFSGATPGDR